MEILRTILFYTRGKSMDCIVIGGHAINAHGLDRHTGDLDLVVPKEQRQQWLDLMADLRYQLGQNTETFARFRPDSIAAWPIDLMFVDTQTFGKMKAAATNFEFGVTQAPVASIKHLMALKLHALRQGQKHREAKDLADLLFLARHSNFNTEELRAFCTQYGSAQIAQTVLGILTDG